MISLENTTELTVDTKKLEAIAKTQTDKDIELLIVKKETIQALNLEHRGKNRPTDVLSFAYDKSEFSDVPLGSIVICDAFVKKEAKKYGHSKEDESALLFIHGLLHLLGFDHEVDSGEMRTKEEEIIGTFNLPKSLIIREEV